MSYKIEEVEGIGPEFGKMLRVANIQTTADLLRECGSKAGRVNMAKISGITEKHLLEWVNLADLMRLDGVGEEFADLLEEAGVDTTQELARRNAENLAVAVAEINEKKNLTQRVPSAETIQKWIDEAGTVEDLISH